MVTDPAVRESIQCEYEHCGDDNDAAESVDSRSPVRLPAMLRARAAVEDAAEDREDDEQDRRGNTVDVRKHLVVSAAGTGEHCHTHCGNGGSLAEHHLEDARSVVGEEERTDREEKADEDVTRPSTLVVRGADRGDWQDREERREIGKREGDDAHDELQRVMINLVL